MYDCYPKFLFIVVSLVARGWKNKAERLFISSVQQFIGGQDTKTMRIKRRREGRAKTGGSRLSELRPEVKDRCLSVQVQG